MVTIGFIGIGNILPSHLKALEANPEYRLVSVCCRSENRLRQTAARLGVKGFTNYRDLLAEKPEVVLVSVPHSLHAEIAIEALRAGCHVLVEKPMAVKVEECNQMLRSAESQARHLLITEAASFQPGALLTGEKFKAGELGRFLTGSIINARFYFHAGRADWFLNPAMSGGGMFINVGMHRLAIARACLAGLTPLSVSASVCQIPHYEIEACTSALVKYQEGGAMLYEEVGYFQRPEWLNCGTHFIFESGIVAWDEKTWRILCRDGRQFDEKLPITQTPYAPIYANMLRAIRGEEYGPKAWEYATDVAIAQAAYASSREGKEIDLRSPEWTIFRSDAP